MIERMNVFLIAALQSEEAISRTVFFYTIHIYTVEHTLTIDYGFFVSL
jgi:hypothetical protein